MGGRAATRSLRSAATPVSPDSSGLDRTIATDDGARGDVAGTTDYRTVLAEVLAKRCGQTGLSTVFPGMPSGQLGVVRPRV